MKNAILMAGEYNALLPALEIPGHTEGYEAFSTSRRCTGLWRKPT